MTAEQILTSWNQIREVCHHRPQGWFALLSVAAAYPKAVSRADIGRAVGYRGHNGLNLPTMKKWERAGLVTLDYHARPAGSSPGPKVIIATATPKLFRLLRLKMPD